MSRSLSQTMYEYTTDLVKNKQPNPYMRQVNGLTMMQVRVYANQDHLLPEDQWAQITMKYDLTSQDGERQQQFNVFERRLADKLSYFDWKLCYQGSLDEYKFIHSK